MKHPRFLLGFLLFALAAGTAVGLAEPAPFQIDPGHSLVGFNVRHLFSRTPGRFKEFSGTIQFDEKNLTASSVDVTIKAASIDTENDRRDNDLRSANFFLTDSFPTLTFKSTKVLPGTEKNFKVHGDLTIKGVTKPVILETTLMGVGPVGMGGRASTAAGFEAKTTIDRKDFGIVWNRALDQGGTLLGDEVTITLQIEARKVEPDAAKPAAAAKPGK